MRIIHPRKKHLLNINFAGIINMRHFVSSKQAAWNMKNIDTSYCDIENINMATIWLVYKIRDPDT